MGLFYVFLLAIVCLPTALFVYRRKVILPAASVVVFALLGGMAAGCGAVQTDVASAADVINKNSNDVEICRSGQPVDVWDATGETWNEEDAQAILDSLGCEAELQETANPPQAGYFPRTDDQEGVFSGTAL